MRKYIISIILLTNAGLVFGQHAQDLKQGNSDYGVPIPVAMNALTAHATPMMVPYTVRDITASIFNERSSMSSTVIGTEVAPFLIGRNIDLSDYLSGRLMRVLLRTRLSFAYDVSSPRSRFALGVRWMLHDDADIRSDSSFQRALVNFGTNAGFDKYCAQKYSDGSDDHIACITEKIASTNTYQNDIDSLRRAMNDALWNRSVFEIAFVSAYSESYSHIDVRRLYGFINAGFPIFGRSDRLDFGVTISTGYDDNDVSRYKRQADLTLRMNYGWFDQHFFAGVKLTAVNYLSPDHRIELGTAAGLGSGVWLRPEISVSLNERSLHKVIGSVSLSYGSL